MSRPSSPKSFGLFFAVIFLVYAIGSQTLPWFARWLIAVSGAALAVTALFRPGLLEKPNLIWYQFGLLLQKIISPILMGIFFFLFFSPLAILLRVFGSRFLDLEISSSRQTYWISRKGKSTATDSLRKQF